MKKFMMSVMKLSHDTEYWKGLITAVLFWFATFIKLSSLYLQDNYNVLHIASMYSREDVVKTLLNKKGVDAFSTGGVRYLLSLYYAFILALSCKC